MITSLTLHCSLRASLRSATVKTKQNLEKRHERERNAVLEGSSDARSRLLEQ